MAKTRSSNWNRRDFELRDDCRLALRRYNAPVEAHMLWKTMWPIALLAALAPRAESVELLGPGRYSGVVIFDRWDGCILYHGVHLMYVSEAVKHELRPHAGKHITVHAADVWQPMNPGDALIRRLKIVDSPVQQPPTSGFTGRLMVSVEARFDEGKPMFAIFVTNQGPGAAVLEADKLAPTLLGRRPAPDTELLRRALRLHPADGPSWALITRQSLRFESGGRICAEVRYQWSISEGQRPPPHKVMQRGDRIEIGLSLTLPPGEYEFLAGYGAEPAVASERISFDVDADGTARAVRKGPEE